MDNRDLAMLEFHKCREIVAGFTSFSASRELAMELHPLRNREEILVKLGQSAEARRLLALKPDFHVGEIIDVRQAAEMAGRGKVLEPQTLLETRTTLESTHQLRSALENLPDELPLLSGIAGKIVELRQIAKHIGDCLSPSGEVLDSASPRLAEIRHRQRDVRRQLLARLEAIVKSPDGQKIVQEPIVTEREGRYVIPVKIESRREMKGIVHDVSNTGATLFVEPWAIVDTGNELRELVAEEKHEIDRIMAALSAGVGVYRAEISRNIVLVAEIDLALAKARYAARFKAAEPVIVASGENTGEAGDESVLKLVDARHPLLGAQAVPLSVEIGRDFSVLVITGPNTGGKTVALKTIGLLSLMAQSGLPIPASAESRIPLFDGIFADIGDEQSIEQTLSTFSWHVSNIARIIQNSSDKSLVLLDELGTNTDPGEGSALARSILLHFLSRRTMTVATTHYSELKAFAHVTDGLQNASLDIDPVTMAPTYHLTLGIPGGSNALATASRLGLPQEIITGARNMLSKGAQELETLLSHLLSEQKAVEALRHSLEKAKDEAEQRNVELENRLQQLQAEEQRAMLETRDRIVREAADLQKEIRQAVSWLRKDRTAEKIEQARQALSSVRGQLKGEAWQIKADEETGVMPIAPGDTVRLKEAQVNATVLSVLEETGQVEVQAGNVRLTISLESVEKTVPSIGATKPSPVPLPGLSRRAVPFELDLRGKRADEVEPALDSYLNDASLSSLNEVRIVHGIGTGVVRQIVRDYLASHPLVKSFRPGGRGEGSDGATVVRL